MTATNLQRSSVAFLSDRRGAVALVFGLFALALGLAAGGAIDIARWSQAKRSTNSALDAAVLAGAHWLQLNPTDTSGALAAAASVYSQNVSRRFALSTDTVSFITADNDTAVTATGDANIETTLLKLAGIPTLPIVSTVGTAFPKASIQVGGMGGSNIEVSLILDVTGSMCNDGSGPCTSDTKIAGLKAAASDLVNIVVQADQSKFTSKVAVVPFTTQIRVAQDGAGASLMQTLTGLPATWTGWQNICTASTGSWSGGGSEGGGSGDWACTTWTPTHYVNAPIIPCVTDRFYNSGWQLDATEAIPGSGTWLNAGDGSRFPLSSDSSDTALTSGTGQNKLDPAGNWDYDLGGTGSCWGIWSTNEIMPLTSDKAALTTRINGLTAYGGTAGALATQWGWYVLSPGWGSIWGGYYGTQSVPSPYSDLTTLQSNGSPKLRKVAILMTDGGFNAYRSWEDQDQQTVSDWAVQVCTNMKAQGIEVYTVGFALNQLTAGEQAIATATLQACGTDIKHFYDTLTVPQLQQAFRQIATNLSSLRLSQ